MSDEDVLHAGVAVMQVVRDVYRSSFKDTGPSEQVLRFVQIALSRLRQRISRQDYTNDNGSIMAVLFMCHLSVSAI